MRTVTKQIACPRCGHQRSKAVQTRGLDRGEGIHRERICSSCSHRFSTVELPVGDTPPGAFLAAARTFRTRADTAAEIARLRKELRIYKPVANTEII